MIVTAERHKTLELPSSLHELYQVRMSLGKLIHQSLDFLSKRGFGGLVISDGLCPGKVQDALAANDGSSHYLKGSLIKLLPERETLDEATINFISKNNLQGELFIGSYSNNSGNFCFIKQNHKKITTLGKFTFPASEIEKETSAIDLLIKTAKWINSHHHNLCNEHEIQSCLALNENLISDEALKIKLQNKIFWQELSRHLRESYSGTISIGESFTFGKLCSLFSSETNILDTAYGWYHPKYKAVVGVPEELLTEDKIAEPKTMEVASLGLFNISSVTTKITIATSGRANNWEKDQADYFSIGLSKKTDQEIKSSMIKFEVTKTQNDPKNRDRREITRELGVTGAMLLLAETLPSNKEILSFLSRISDYLSQYGRIININ